MSLRVAVVHDYLTQRGGAERVTLAIRRAFPDTRLMTSVYNPDGTFPDFRDLEVSTSWLQRVPAFRRNPRLALPLLPGAFSRLKVPPADVVVCSSTGFAHGVITDAPKVVYCHNPPRWLYQSEDYLRDQPVSVRAALRMLAPGLKRWDQQAAASAARYLVNSSLVRERVRRAYGIDAEVLPPPAALRPGAPQERPDGLEPGFFLVVGRPRGYKNVEAVCAAFAALPEHRLVVVGGLPSGDWPSHVRGLSDLSDAALSWVYAHCRAVVSVSHEDFGLTPVEGYQFGKPALLLRAGGFLDTMDEGTTGLFVEAATAEAVRAAVRAFERSSFDAAAIQRHGHAYTDERFARRLQEVVQEVASGQPS